jgi:triacylglycerol esterase/lipase EstA (alpha/beta hydrolase family)
MEPDVKSIDFPPKVYFNKAARQVAASRKISLDSFLKGVVKICEDFDTPEQDMLFRFLDAYKNISNDIYDDLSVGTWREVKAHAIFILGMLYCF